MCRKMNFSTLAAYLSSSHAQVLLCRSHSEKFSLSNEEYLDADAMIFMHMTDLEELRQKLAASCEEIFATDTAEARINVVSASMA